ncbi:MULTISPECIES: hypothetical protein [Idiomarina]|uniref:hypothetical protein n=1 Tax=Idiomarina TaxID=135575 RepID=UPI000C091537|nr:MULTISPECIES: hypothetical protein [Idiomarina]MAC35603.1 hypothetical protein [Haliea sp.]MAO67914.1 hypothetical protein [Idiomarina sp.]MBF79656.1 hypothetical protein [Idiomarina sp.]|tara:strand:- start:44 stop:307 length:264 start_codon:yes stop_codon:yes gene_type:complete
MKKTANQSVEVITDILCDACGASVLPNFQKENCEDLSDFRDYGTLRASYGYGSNQDGDSFHFDLCESCFKELVDKVKSMKALNSSSV